MANEKRLIDGNKAQAVLVNMAEHLQEAGNPEMAGAVGYAAEVIGKQSTVDAVEVVRCAYCDPGSQDYNPCWLCKKGGTAHDVEHCHRTNYGDYEPMQPHCHLCGRKL